MSVTINHETNDISATSGSLTIDGGSTIPSGVIVMWSGTNADIPSGWALCDGNNGTPNLVDRFILARSAASNTNSTGGGNTVTLAEANLPSHSHGMSSVTTGGAGSHSHNFNANTGNSGNHSHSGTGANHTHSFSGSVGYRSNSGGNTTTNYWKAMSVNRYYNQYIMGKNRNTSSAGAASFNTNSAGSHSHNFNANTGNVGNHTHNISGNTDAAGSGSALTVTPIYFTLAFIMKT